MMLFPPPEVTPNISPAVQALNATAGQLPADQQAAHYHMVSTTPGGSQVYWREQWFTAAKGFAAGAALVGLGCYLVCNRWRR